MIFSGMVVPLPLFPDWAQPILNALPFRGIVDVPFRLYMGHLPVTEAPFLIAQQILWVVVIVFVGRLVMGIGVSASSSREARPPSSCYSGIDT